MSVGLSSSLVAHPRYVFQSIFGAARSLPRIASPFTHIYLHSDRAGWALDEEAVRMTKKARQLGFSSSRYFPYAYHLRQHIHSTSQFTILDPRFLKGGASLSFDYFHGKPGTSIEFDKVYNALASHRDRFNLIRCTHEEMRKVILSTGFDPHRVVKLPIPVDTDIFFQLASDIRQQLRSRIGAPNQAVIIGSFQKDGEGWADGNKPKMIKGPDILVQTLAMLKKSIPNLFVLLAGPARGYVKAQLDSAGVPYKHYICKNYSEINLLYNCIDLYLITSRQEGGPKSLLEAMACGVTVVSTKVGQATELIAHGKNGYLTEQSPAEISEICQTFFAGTFAKEKLASSAIETAKKFSWISMNLEWQGLFGKMLSK